MPIIVGVLLHHKTKHEFMFCIDDAKEHLNAVLQLQYKSFCVLMRLELCNILKLFLEFKHFELQYSYTLYPNKEGCTTHEDDHINVNEIFHYACIIQKVGHDPINRRGIF